MKIKSSVIIFFVAISLLQIIIFDANAKGITSLLKSIKRNKSGSSVDDNGNIVPEHLMLSREELKHCLNLLKKNDNTIKKLNAMQSEAEEYTEKVDAMVKIEDSTLENIDKKLQSKSLLLTELTNKIQSIKEYLLKNQNVEFKTKESIDYYNDQLAKYNLLLKEHDTLESKYNSQVNLYNLKLKKVQTSLADYEQTIDRFESTHKYLIKISAESKQEFDTQCADKHYDSFDAQMVGFTEYLIQSQIKLLN